MDLLYLFDFRLYELFLYFVSYAFIGWCLEVCYAAYVFRRFVNRGFLTGPFCPVYGFGVVILIVTLSPVKNDAFLLFIGAIILTSSLEYLTGFILETAFHSRWWDYSNERFNIKGRICLRFSILWGIVSVIVLNTIHPFIAWLIGTMEPDTCLIACYILLAYFTADLGVTIAATIGLNIRLKKLHNLSSEILTHLEAIKGTVSIKAGSIENKILHELRVRYRMLAKKRSVLHTRIIDAFPDLKSIRFDGILKELRINIDIRRKALRKRRGR